MHNPILTLMRKYDSIPVSAIVVELTAPMTDIKITIVRYGGCCTDNYPSLSRARQSARAEADNRDRMGLGPRPQESEEEILSMSIPGIEVSIWEHLPDIVCRLKGEYLSREIDVWVREAAKEQSALDILRVDDGNAVRWHYRPCNPKHWTIRKMGRRSYRMPTQPDDNKEAR